VNNPKSTSNKGSWQCVIPEICKTLDEAGIKYHADASSSLFVHGLPFEMDDFDVTVEWGKLEEVRQLFAADSPTEIEGNSPQRFQFIYRHKAIDVMAYESDSGIGPAQERTLVNFSGYDIWSKTPDFYLQRMKQTHPLRQKALSFFDNPKPGIV
jgi:hypothetical protein